MVKANYFVILYYVLKNKGIDADAWLARSNLSLSQCQSSDFEVSYWQSIKLMHGALSLANQQDLGLEFGSLLDMHSHGDVGVVFSSSDTLENALENGVAYVRNRTRLVSVHFAHIENQNQVAFKIDLPIPISKYKRFIYDTAFACFHQLRCQLVKDADPHCELFLNYHPKNLESYQRCFGDNIHFSSQHCEYRFNADDLKKPIIFSNPIVNEAAKHNCQLQLQKFSKGDDTAQTIKSLLMTQLNAFPTLDALAKALHMSERTLRRHLQKNQTNYQTIVEAVRKELAIEYLQSKMDSIESIADKLGYSNGANFSNAFKRWWGISPKQFREQKHSLKDLSIKNQ